MKKFIFILVFGFLGINAFGQAQDAEQSISWQDVEVIYDMSEHSCAVPGEKISNSLQTSLNFGTQKKAKQNNPLAAM